MSTPTPLTITTADERHRPQLEQLWTMFRHEMSAFTGTLPDEHGRFRQERLDAGLSEPDWSAHIFHLGLHPVGLAVLRGLDEEEHIISSFFIAHGARRSRIGRAAVTELTEAHPGRWAVAYQDRNEVAAKFWRTVATEIDPTCTFEHHAVPGQPELPADSWARFGVRPFYASGQASVPRISTESGLRDALQCSGLEEVKQPRDRCDEAHYTKGGS